MILFAIIHNHDSNKLSYIQQNLQNLNEIEATVNYYGWQPVINKVSKIKCLLRDFYYIKIGTKYANYKKLGILYCLLFPIYATYKTIIKKYTLNNLSKWQRASQIEMFVTNKHILAWQNFLETKNEWLVVMEDDMIFKQDSVNKLMDIIHTYTHTHIHTYIDLAGGLKLSSLKIDKLIKCKENNAIYFTKPVTNTACCYLINRAMAELFISELIKNPMLRMIGIDHMMNALCMKKKWNGDDNISIHFEPTVFEHGSVSGAYSPWQR